MLGIVMVLWLMKFYQLGLRGGVGLNPEKVELSTKSYHDDCV